MRSPTLVVAPPDWEHILTFFLEDFPWFRTLFLACRLPIALFVASLYFDHLIPHSFVKAGSLIVQMFFIKITPPMSVAHLILSCGELISTNSFNIFRAA
jgi:hypothetical protein